MCLTNLPILFRRYVTRVRSRSSSTVSNGRKRQRLSSWPHWTQAEETRLHRRGSVSNRSCCKCGGPSVWQQPLLAFAIVSAAATAGERHDASRVFNALLIASSSGSPFEAPSVASGSDDHELIRLEAPTHSTSEQVARTCRGYRHCLLSRRRGRGETGLGKRLVLMKACCSRARRDGGCRVDFCAPIRTDHLIS